MASSSGFSTRNAYYLRISRDTVLSLYAYVEQPYVDWMTDYTLQKVLMELRPLIRPKLALEAGLDKKAASTPEVIIGDGFRFCFFLRPNSNDRHVVLLKDRHYVPRPLPGQEAAVEPEANTAAEDAPPSPPVTRAGEGRGRKRGRDESEQAMSAEPEGSVEIKPEDDGRSTIDEILASTSAAAPERDVPRGQGLFDYGEEEPDEDYKPADVNSHSLALGIDAQEEEEKKAKPLLEMRYQGFSIYSSQLVLIIEPYPLPAATNSLLRRSSSVSVPPTPRPRASSTFSTSTSGTRRTFDRTPSASPWPSLRPSANSRSGTPANEPLFRPMTPLGDEDAEEEQRRDEERQRRWASWRDRSLSVLPSREDSLAPAETARTNDDDQSATGGLDGGGMTNLTQSLMNVGGRQGVDDGED